MAVVFQGELTFAGVEDRFDELAEAHKPSTFRGGEPKIDLESVFAG